MAGIRQWRSATRSASRPACWYRPNLPRTDAFAIGALLETLLNRAGYRTLLTTDGEAGLSAIARANPDLVLLDVGLPRMDGFEVVRRLRSDPHRQILPVIMLTAHSRTDDVVTG